MTKANKVKIMAALLVIGGALVYMRNKQNPNAERIAEINMAISLLRRNSLSATEKAAIAKATAAGDTAAVRKIYNDTLTGAEQAKMAALVAERAALQAA